MELLHDTHIDFMKYRRFWIVASMILVALGFFVVFGTRQLNMGIDFVGGTQITLAFRGEPDLDRIRAVLAQEGFEEAVIQRFGKAEDRQVIVKTAVAKGTEEGSRERVVAALTRAFGTGKSGLDLNQVSADELTQLLVQADPGRVGAQGPESARLHYSALAEELAKQRRQIGVFTSWDQVARVPEVNTETAAALQRSTHLGEFAVVGVENVGPQVGRELRQKGVLAVVLSLLAMFAYIWIRFELRFAIGAVIAVFHDAMVTIGFYTLLDFEFNLTTIAAFLTLVGYSVNDKVVIFDRVREQMRKNRRKPLIDIMNESINQTLSRTILTGGCTLLVLLSLLFWGGDVIRGFAFVMFVGIVVGTYSSIFIASAFTLLWEQLLGVQGKWRKGKPGSLSRGADGRAEPPRIEPKTGEAPPRRTRPARRRA